MTAGTEIGTDSDGTYAIELGDVDGDGDLDVVTGNGSQTNKLYLNDGDGAPFDTIGTGTAIGTDADETLGIALGDYDGDGDLDVVAGNFNQTNKMYLNTGGSVPFDSGAAGVPLGDEADATFTIELLDTNYDGGLEVVVGNLGQPNKIYPTAEFAATIGTGAHATVAMAVGDIDGDGDPDLVSGNVGEANTIHVNRAYDVGLGIVSSATVDAAPGLILSATLTTTLTQPLNTSAEFYLSNNGGARWIGVRPGVAVDFPTTGSELRWRAELRSMSPVLTPTIESVSITAEVAPAIVEIEDHSTTDGMDYTGPVPVLTQDVAQTTWTLVAGPTGMTIDTATGEVSWPGVAFAESPTTITIRVDHGRGTDDESWLLTVVAAPPVIAAMGDDEVTAGQEYQGPAPALTQGTLPVMWTLVDGPAGMTIDPATGRVSWPAATLEGSPHNVTIRATNDSGSDELSWRVSVAEPRAGIERGTWRGYR